MILAVCYTVIIKVQCPYFFFFLFVSLKCQTTDRVIRDEGEATQTLWFQFHCWKEKGVKKNCSAFLVIHNTALMRLLLTVYCLLEMCNLTFLNYLMVFFLNAIWVAVYLPLLWVCLLAVIASDPGLLLFIWSKNKVWPSLFVLCVLVFVFYFLNSCNCFMW